MRINELQPMVTQSNLAAIDLSSLALYTAGNAHLAWQALRTQRPVAWNPLPGGAGFWSVTRYGDVRRVLRDYDTFSSQNGTALDMIGAPDPAAGRMMHATDPPCHTRYRRPLEARLSAHDLSRHQPAIRSMVFDLVATAQQSDNWDAAAALTRLTVAVVVRLMGLPTADIDLLRDAAYGSVAPHDPHYQRGSAYKTIRWSHSTLVDYFTRQHRERHEALSSDLLSFLATMDAGRPLTEEEFVLNCYSLLVGGVVTTSQVMSATLLILTEHSRGPAQWPADAPIAPLIEEALRWSSPTTHFLRTARNDVEMHGVRIRAGDPVAAWVASANRDEGVFDQPYSFKVDRRPNRHLAFGAGHHRCIGRQLARLVLRELLTEFGRRVDRIALVGDPVHLRSTLVAGIVQLPLAITPHR